MNKPPIPRPGPEEWGLRLEGTSRLRLLDLVLFAALVVSGAMWVWVSVAGVGPALVAAIGSPAGRLVAALIGLGSLVALVRAFLISRWPVSENDRSLV